MGKNLKNSKQKLMFNVYGQKTMSELANTFNIVHTVFKYRFWVPLLEIAGYIFRKHDEKQYLDKPHNINLLVFDTAFEESIEVWVRDFLPKVYPYQSMKEEDIQNRINSGSANYLRTMKKIMLMMCKNDTAYFEFFNIFSHKFAKHMCMYYKDKPKHHLFYTSKNIGDFKYFTLYDKITNEVEKDGKH